MKRYLIPALLVLCQFVFAAEDAKDTKPQPGVVSSEFIFDTAPFPSCHASTLVETKSGLVAAWFGGTKEGARDVGIWLSRQVDGKWTEPVEVANGKPVEVKPPAEQEVKPVTPLETKIPGGIEDKPVAPAEVKPPAPPETKVSEAKPADDKAPVAADNKPPVVTEVKPPEDVAAVNPINQQPTLPCWNPVLFQPAKGPLMLFYKIGESPERWKGMVRTSSDDGKTWSEAEKLPDGILGPIKNKPVIVKYGIVVSPSSTEEGGKWRVHFEVSNDDCKTWSISTPMAENPGMTPINAIQPSVLTYPSGDLLAIGRTRDGKLFSANSFDQGKSWGALQLTQLPNPNSGTDAVTLLDGRNVLVYNHTDHGRSPLNVAVSKDGTQWNAALVLENDTHEYSYPCVIQSTDKMIHIAYTWRRTKIKHVILDPEKLELTPIENGQWPN